MLYLEDYLEMIEHLPQELRDRFTEMREMDLSVQNNVDTLEKRVKTFFTGCRRGEHVGDDAESEFETIRSDYYHTLEDADEKVQLANQMYELVEKYLRRLDSELYKFKCELEADHNGITELLEKRSLELDAPPMPSSNTQKENRSYRPRAEKRRDSNCSIREAVTEKRAAVIGGQTTVATVVRAEPTVAQVVPQTSTSSSGYSLQHIGAGNAIAAAASQAIAATQQMQQGRRTASLKASYEAAIHLGASGTGSQGGVAHGSAHELLIGRELAGAAHTALQAIEREGASGQRRQKKKYTTQTAGQISSVSVPQAASSTTVSAAGSPVVLTAPIAEQVGTVVGAAMVEQPVAVPDPDSVVIESSADGEWTYDPNEPKYCLCNQVSYGDMVACDNEDCPFEWFHYPCVNIQSPPKGKWYCPPCIASMRRRGSRKN